MFRYFETFAIIYYLPAFFQQVYPAFKTEYSIYNALIVAILGFLSTLVAGIISDRFEKKNRMTKAIVCMTGSLLAIPAIYACTIGTTNFYWALAFMGMKFFISEGW